MKTVARTIVVLLLVSVVLACSTSPDDADSKVQPVDVNADADATGPIPDQVAADTQTTPDIEPDNPECPQQCEDKECGPDGCGANCGICGGLQVCLDGLCCSPACDEKNCGPDGCGGSCGQCTEPDVCLEGICCEPACAGKNCGPDGCGGVCGYCGPAEFCMDGTCSFPDQDTDGVPDDADLFPQDPNMPGTVALSMVYAHTSDTLYSMDVKLYKLTEIGEFIWPNDGATHKMTDIGIDSYGVLYGTSYEYLYTVHPQTRHCSLIAKLPDSFNALTLVPAGLIEQDKDVLIGISGDGGWFRLDIDDGDLFATQLGSYGPDYKSAGDAYSIVGVGTYAAVYRTSTFGDNYLIAVDPVDGSVEYEVGEITGYTGIFGLAGWTDKAFAFDKTGAVVIIDTVTTEVKVLHDTSISWWGAGVQAVIPK
jgi:hypothetical protein